MTPKWPSVDLDQRHLLAVVVTNWKVDLTLDSSFSQWILQADLVANLTGGGAGNSAAVHMRGLHNSMNNGTTF